MNDNERPPGLIKWAGYLAVLCLLVLPLSVITVRAGVWQPGLGLYAVACLGSTLLAIIAITLLLVPRFADHRGVVVKRVMLPALPGTLLLLSLTTGGNHPRIHNITTDLEDPPTFVTAAEQRGASANPHVPDPAAMALQRDAYPDLQTLRSALTADAAFTRAVAVSRDLGWEIYNENREAGIIEAVETTRVMGFKDDVVIRIRAADGASQIDLRSVSRVGLGDLGANAKRIRAFGEAFNKGN